MRNIRDLECIGSVMTNFDRSIDRKIEKELREKPGTKADYPGWNFYGSVWFEDGQFTCQVWRYHVPIKEITEDTLEELMETVSSEFGYD